jgi:hypothetical protein
MDDDIDFSDIPELTPEQLRKFRPLREARPQLWEAKRNGLTLISTKPDASPVTDELINEIREEEE